MRAAFLRTGVQLLAYLHDGFIQRSRALFISSKVTEGVNIVALNKKAIRSLARSRITNSQSCYRSYQYPGIQFRRGYAIPLSMLNVLVSYDPASPRREPYLSDCTDLPLCAIALVAPSIARQPYQHNSNLRSQRN